MVMLEAKDPLTIDELNLATQAWVEQKYHRTRHSEVNDTPLTRYLAAPNVLRPSPDADTLRAAFRVDVVRRRLTPPAQSPATTPEPGTPALLAQLLADYAATGLPPAYLPTTDQELAP